MPDRSSLPMLSLLSRQGKSSSRQVKSHWGGPLT
jgi:hypothetical protein